jgi:hypothetical protein
MKTEENNNLQDMEKLKDIPKWTREYAQNKMLTGFVHSIISLLIIFIGIGAPFVSAKIAFITGHIILLWVCIAALITVSICFIYISVPNLGGKKFWNWIDKQIYGEEGSVSLPEPKLRGKKKFVEYVIRLAYIVLFLVLYALSKRYIPIKYMQPVSVLYVVPFMVFLYLWQKPKISPIFLLLPLLYTIHGVLIVSGVPILFTGNLTYWNMFLPFFGYGFLTFIISHLYNRYALKKLKDLTHLEGDTADGD